MELEITNTGSSGGALAAGDARPRAFSASDGRGLLGMRERALIYDGELDVGPTQDGGWRVHLRLQADAASPQTPLELVS